MTAVRIPGASIARPVAAVDPVEMRLAQRRALRRNARRAAVLAWWNEVADELPSGWWWKIPASCIAGYALVILILVTF